MRAVVEAACERDVGDGAVRSLRRG
jgi:ketosteroid isomerase-like protein